MCSVGLMSRLSQVQIITRLALEKAGEVGESLSFNIGTKVKGNDM